MEMIIKQVEVPKHVAEFAEAVAEIVKATKVALADGFQPGSDIPVIVAAAWAKLPAAVAGIEMLPAELAHDKGKFALALAIEIEKFV
jgi:hypothetical protein